MCALPGIGETPVNGPQYLRNLLKIVADAGNLGTPGSGKFEEENPTFSTELRLKDKNGNYHGNYHGIWLDVLVWRPISAPAMANGLNLHKYQRSQIARRR